MTALVMCASRDRPEALTRMLNSVVLTSDAHARVYVDDDQRALYADCYSHPRVKYTLGPRVGPCASLEALAAGNPGFSAYGAATDDCEFLTPGWDAWVLERCGQPRFFSPNGTRMDFPWMSGPALRALGSFIPTPKNVIGGDFQFRHYYWDVALEVLADSVGALVRTRGEFVIRHHEADPAYTQEEQQWILGADARALALWAAFSRPVDIERLRKAGA